MFWDVVGKCAIALTCALSAGYVAHESRLAVIESTRFTAKDGSSLERRLTNAFPPEWLKNDLADIKLQLKEIEKRLTRIEVK